MRGAFGLLLPVALLACHPKAADSVDSCAAGGDSGCAAYTVTADATVELPAPLVLPNRAYGIAIGDLEGTGVPQIYVGTGTTVTRFDGDGWATATDIWTESDASARPLIADLTGDGVADLLMGLPDADRNVGQVLVFTGPVVDPITWDTPHLEIKGDAAAASPGAGALAAGEAIWAADMDGDDVLDLVVKAAGQTWIRPGPLTATEPLGAAGDIEWADSDVNKQEFAAVGDIDGDGVPDLVFVIQASDGPCGLPGTEIHAVTGPFSPGTYSLDAAPIVLTPPPDAIDAGGVSITDVDGDGVNDLVASAPTRLGGIPALIWRGPISSGEPPVEIPSTFGEVGIGDFGGNGAPDLLELNLQASSAGIWDTGAQGVVTVTNGPVEALTTRALCNVAVTQAWTGWPISYEDASWTGDLDGDGVSDAILATGSSLYLLRSGA